MEEKTIKKGDVFYTSWGYDQTNYDFIIVEKVSPSAKTVICKRTTCERMEEKCSMTIDALKPKKSSFGKPFRMKVMKWNDEVMLRGSYIFCGDEDSESKRLDSFSKHKEGKTYGQTNSQFGH